MSWAGSVTEGRWVRRFSRRLPLGLIFACVSYPPSTSLFPPRLFQGRLSLSGPIQDREQSVGRVPDLRGWNTGPNPASTHTLSQTPPSLRFLGLSALGSSPARFSKTPHCLAPGRVPNQRRRNAPTYVVVNFQIFFHFFLLRPTKSKRSGDRVS